VLQTTKKTLEVLVGGKDFLYQRIPTNKCYRNKRDEMVFTASYLILVIPRVTKVKIYL
jgi:hypothetical protein